MKKLVKKIKKDYDREISIIVSSIEPRINECMKKFEDGLYNEATMFAFWLGMEIDLKSALDKIEKRKKNDN